jgi:cytochrome c553
VSRSAGLAVTMGVAAALMLVPTTILADMDDTEVEARAEAILALGGDPAYGEYLGGECGTCHRRSERADGIPQISGIEAHHFVRAMVEYREGIRTNEVMRTTAARLSDEEIAALAAHFTERATR